ncbi:acyl-CoA dehydrogenase [Paraburkholderia sp. CNPSo 3157]|uniref:Acyl-CoA dehydrogenase n=1 Tax=Paraburkholderia franconis TaxID=2654983 RepID=A0A7X1TKE9_9BURK|nr:acyl-CoA dehydrogenase family protein [Paraburkholderia franconis]MPW22334.1 acyl-CoA dehydrogenase [Paraburkholderia franconis]
MSSVLKSDIGHAVPGEDELIERARAMVPWLRTRAAEVEAARGVPADIIEKFREAGFLRVLQPRRWGGYEMNPSVFFKILMEVGRGCSSSAWNLMILGVHPWEFGLFDPRAGDDVWGRDDSVIVASSYAPVGACRRVEGGYVISGRWPTSSGTDHGQWAILGVMAPGEEGKPPVDRIAVLVPRSAYTIIDDWQVCGLAGTGSKSLQVQETFVPECHTHSLADYSMSDRGSMYLFPFTQVFCGSVSAVIVGMAQGAIDLFVEQMATRRNSGNGKQTSASPYVKDRLGNATALVRSSRARLLMMQIETTPIVERRELIPLASRVAYALDIARVGRECDQAVQLLFKALSARGIYLDNPIQRIVRDVMAASNHITQNADDNAGNLGGFLMGEALPPLQYAR